MEKKKFVFEVIGAPNFTMLLGIDKVVNAGWVGRDKESLMAHINELKEEGIPAPETVPICFPILNDRITQEESIEVFDEAGHSGEAEFVLLFHKGEIYVGAGSDHTDRRVEVLSVPKSKVFYPNVVSRTAWRYTDVQDHWNSLILRSWITNSKGVREVYQEDALSSILDPESLVAFVKQHLQETDDLEGLCIFSGTIPAKIKIQYSSLWDVQLEDPVLNRSIFLRYECVPADRWFARRGRGYTY
jgi:hypothetical protein